MTIWDSTDPINRNSEDDLCAKNRREAIKLCPFDGICVKVEGGWMFFESPDDYNIWRTQR